MIFNPNFLFSLFYRWYFRKIKRIEAEKKLLLPENEHGAFLIRDSESRHNDYSLSGLYRLFNMLMRLLTLEFQQCEMEIRWSIIEFGNWTKVDFSSHVEQHLGKEKDDINEIIK